MEQTRIVEKKKREIRPYDPNHYCGYTLMLRGGVKHLTWKQQMMITEVALLANDYEHLRRFIQQR